MRLWSYLRKCPQIFAKKQADHSQNGEMDATASLGLTSRSAKVRDGCRGIHVTFALHLRNCAQLSRTEASRFSKHTSSGKFDELIDCAWCVFTFYFLRVRNHGCARATGRWSCVVIVIEVVWSWWCGWTHVVVWCCGVWVHMSRRVCGSTWLHCAVGVG